MLFIGFLVHPGIRPYESICSLKKAPHLSNTNKIINLIRGMDFRFGQCVGKELKPGQR